ncbi:MAG: hypothetical protein LBF68_06820 [Christensenellaceae bacterium]|jgi:hypothetical protein|nr:hypothetical protein [Christensenellaceae bacterium]
MDDKLFEGCEYSLSVDYSEEGIRAFRRLYPTINNNTLKDILAKYSNWLLDYNPLRATNSQDDPHNIKGAVWHGLTHPDKDVQAISVLNSDDGYFVQLYDLIFSSSSKTLWFDYDQMCDFYFEQTGESFYDDTNYVGEKQMENYCGVVFTPHTDPVVIQRQAQIEAANSVRKVYIFSKRPNTPPSSVELERYKRCYNYNLFLHSKYPNIENPAPPVFENNCVASYKRGYFTHEFNYIKTYENSIIDGESKRLAICIDNKFKQDIDWYDLIKEVIYLSLYYGQKEMIVFKNGFPKDLAINKYIILEPKKTLKVKEEERIAAEKKREVYELKQKIIQEKVNAEFGRHAIKR